MKRRHALRLVDDALVLTRDAGARALLRATWPSLALTWLALVAYATERIEGVGSLRPAFAACALALWCARGVRLGELACRSLSRVLARDDVPLPLRSRASVAASAGWALIPALTLALPLVVLARSEPFWALLGLPVLALRALTTGRVLVDAPLSNSPPGLRTLFDSARALEGSRVRALAVELLLTAATLVLAFDFGAAASALVALSQDVLGFELALVRAFLAPSNVFVTLGALGLASAFVDALRASTAALIVAEDLARERALSVRDAVEAALRSPRRASPLGRASLLALLLVAAPAQAAPHAAPLGDAGDSTCDLACGRVRAHDDDLGHRVSDILKRPEFRSFEVAPGSLHGEPEWLRGVLVWIDRLARRRGLAPAIPDRVQVLLLPSAWVFLAAATLVTLATLSLRLRRAPDAAPPAQESALPDPPLRARALLDEARLLSEHDPRSAMRTVFLATLSALSERGIVGEVACRTNNRLEHELQGSAFHGLFRALRIDFEASVYGDQSPPRERVRAHVDEVAAVFSLGEIP
jgi:hypothetical protein